MGSVPEGIDHIGLAVPDLESGIEDVHRRTGVRPTLLPPERGQWYRRATLCIGQGCTLEVIAPNAAHHLFHPMKTILRQLQGPFLLFWSMATDDMQTAQSRIRACGGRLSRIRTVGSASDRRHPHYDLATIGPGFETLRPCLINWHHRGAWRPRQADCHLQGLELTDPDPARFHGLFGSLDIGLTVRRGPSAVKLTLQTPKGMVSFQNPSWRFTLPVLIGSMLCDLLDTVADAGASRQFPLDRL